MPITTVLFDLDGTLLPMDQDVFVKNYFMRLAEKLAPLGYVPDELIKAIWAGTGAMIKNTGEKSNEDVFWDVFCSIFGEKSREDMPYFDEYYKTDFQKVKEVCGYTPKAAQTLKRIKAAGFRMALATNPIFPAIATESRVRWAGLDISDFELYTTYENIGYCKPNLDYYKEIIKHMHVSPEECLMVGNDVSDDMVAEKLGMQVFLLTDCLINKDNVDIAAYPNGTFDDLIAYLNI